MGANGLWNTLNLKGNAGADFVGAAGDVMTGVFDGTNWYFNVQDNTP